MATQGLSNEDRRWLERAIEIGREGMRKGSGGPFGAVVVRDGRELGAAHNEVIEGHDPTAHAEVQAIRKACSQVGDFRLTGATIYASCEPCPMCSAAIHWARFERIVFAASREDAAAIGFDDALLYDEIAKSPAERTPPMEQHMRDAARTMMDEWSEREDRVDY